MLQGNQLFLEDLKRGMSAVTPITYLSIILGAHGAALLAKRS